jgi:hypothetical protein
LLWALRRGEQPFEIVQGHVGVRTAGQQPAKGMTQLAQTFQTDGCRDVAEDVPAALKIMEAPGLKEGPGGVKRFQMGTQLICVHEPG